jgi:5-methyltetrahydrofolate--homocysteine methyltransferase
MKAPALTIIGERVNASRKSIARAIDSGDDEFIGEEARIQVEAGANFLDVNAGTYPDKEAQILAWLVRASQAAVPAPLSIDTSSADALEAALEAHRGKPLINSISLEKERMETVLPLIRERSCAVIAQTLESGRIPTEAQERVDIAMRLVDALTDAGLEPEDIYVDPLVRPVSMIGDAGAETLKAFSSIRARLPEVHIICGVGNVSFQLPGRSLLDRTFLAMAMAAGADAAIIDPCNNDIMASVAAAEALLGKDEFCMRYINAHREKKIAGKD